MTKEQFISEWLGSPWKDRGIEKDGVDCYGLVHCYMRDVMGIEVSKPGDYENINSGFAQEVESGKWREVESPRHGLVFMSFRGDVAMHCGITLDERQVLHCFGTPTNHGTVSVNSIRAIQSTFGNCKFYERVV